MSLGTQLLLTVPCPTHFCGHERRAPRAHIPAKDTTPPASQGAPAYSSSSSPSSDSSVHTCVDHVSACRQQQRNAQLHVCHVPPLRGPWMDG